MLEISGLFQKIACLIREISAQIKLIGILQYSLAIALLIVVSKINVKFDTSWPN